MVLKIIVGFVAGIGRVCKNIHLHAAVCLLALMSLATGDPPDSPATRPSSSIAQNVIAELIAADQARDELQQAEQQWAMEEEKLQMLIDSVNRRAEQLRREADKAEKNRSELKKQVADEQAQQQRLVEVEAMVDALAERLEQALETLKGHSLPGVVPPDTAAGITDPLRRFSADINRLAKTEQNNCTSTVELVNAELGGRTVTVKLLRAGGAAAWWMSLDGKKAGQATMQDEELMLDPAADEQDAESIKKAFAIAEGQSAPHWTLLPVHHLNVDKNEEQEQ